jgi:hypothetical protein
MDKFPIYLVVGKFSKCGTYMVLKNVEVQGGILQDLHDVMYMY